MKKNIFIFLLVFIVSLFSNIEANSGGHHSRGYSHHSYKSSSHSRSYHVSNGSTHSHTYHVSSNSYNSYHYTSGSTYKVGTTTYESGKYYSKTGQPKVERSSMEKKKFLKSQGYNKVPTGYEVDHIVPLSDGGKDDPSNMQLLTKSEHKQKTARERAEHRKHH